AWYSERARTAPNAAQRLQCYDRALAIYTRLGRPHQAVELGLRYRDFLRSGGSRAAGHGDARWRLRELDLRLGAGYLALGPLPPRRGIPAAGGRRPPRGGPAPHGPEDRRPGRPGPLRRKARQPRPGGPSLEAGGGVRPGPAGTPEPRTHPHAAGRVRLAAGRQ